jgi:hypothetical protein
MGEEGKLHWHAAFRRQVIPAQAGIQAIWLIYTMFLVAGRHPGESRGPGKKRTALDSGFRRNDVTEQTED